MDVDAKKYPIALKSVVASGVGLTGFTVYKIAPKIKNVAVKVSTKIAGKIGTKTVAKTGGKAIAKIAGNGAKAIPIVGWGITAAICIWDIVDYSRTAREGKAMLRNNLELYFHEVKQTLLGDTNESIMGSITVWENKMIRNLR